MEIYIITYCEIEVRGYKASRGSEGMPLRKFQNFGGNDYFNKKSTGIKMHVPSFVLNNNNVCDVQVPA